MKTAYNDNVEFKYNGDELRFTVDGKSVLNIPAENLPAFLNAVKTLSKHHPMKEIPKSIKLVLANSDEDFDSFSCRIERDGKLMNPCGSDHNVTYYSGAMKALVSELGVVNPMGVFEYISWADKKNLEEMAGMFTVYIQKECERVGVPCPQITWIIR